MNVFVFSNPADLVQSFIDENRTLGKIKTRLAEAANCKLSYFSNVIQKKVNLTPDQAFGLSKFMSLNEKETEFFLLLVQESRAGAPELRVYLNNKIKKMRQKEFKLETKFKKLEMLTPEEVRIYYTSWHHQAIHMLLTIPKYGRPENVAKRLQLPIEIVIAKLKILEDIGLAQKKGDYWSAIIKNIHIPIHDPSSLGHQIQWKLQSIVDLQNPKTEGLHYSSVYSLSLEDFQKIKSMMISFIEETRKRIELSPEEEIVHFQLSFFQI